MNILEEIKVFFSETIRKRNNNHRLSAIKLQREAGIPHQVLMSLNQSNQSKFGAVPAFLKQT